MTLDTTFRRQLFTKNAQLLAGPGNSGRSILKPFVRYKKLSGDVAYVDGYSPLTTLETRVGSDTYPEAFDDHIDAKVTRRQAEDTGITTVAHLLSMMTPHVEINRQRTLFEPNLAEWGHETDEDQVWLEMEDPKHHLWDCGMRSIFLSEDYFILSALSAASVTRGQYKGSTSAVSLPASQSLTLAFGTYAGELKLDAFSEIRQKFREQYIMNEPIFLVISPQQETHLIQNSGATIQSKDFVDNKNYFEKGVLPHIYGIHVIVHPLVADTAAYAWCPSGVCWGEFDPLKTDFDKIPNHRCAHQLYIREKAACNRVDDLRVVQISIPAS